MSNKDTLEFDEIATNIFGPIYSVIANQIKEKTGLNLDDGLCLDIGCGGGHLGIAMAEISNMDIYLFDKSVDALDIAYKRIKSKNLDKRVKTLHGNVQDIPLSDECVKLAVSRGSVWFWEDQVKAFREIYRILSPGGCAYIGGGFGNKDLGQEIDRKMLEKNESWENKKKNMRGDNSKDKFKRILKEENIDCYEIIDDESGLWVMIRK